MNKIKVIAQIVLLAVDLGVHVVTKVRKYKIFRKREKKFPEFEVPEVPEVPGVQEKAVD